MTEVIIYIYYFFTIYFILKPYKFPFISIPFVVQIPKEQQKRHIQLKKFIYFFFSRYIDDIIIDKF